MSEKISSCKDLRVDRLAFELQQELFGLSKLFPPEERYSLTDQLRHIIPIGRCKSRGSVAETPLRRSFREQVDRRRRRTG